MKTCKDCNQEKPHADYYKLTNSPDGLDRRCKECAKAYRKNRSKKLEGSFGPTKVCNKCGTEKSRDEFYANSGHPDGKTSICKVCHKAYQKRIKESEKTVPEEKACAVCKVVKPKNDFYHYSYSKNGLTTKCKQCHAEFYKENTEVYSARKKAYRQNPENLLRIYETEKARREANPEKYREYAQKRLNLKADAEFDPLVTVDSLRERQGDKCHYCGEDLDFSPKKRGDAYNPLGATVDHVIPLSKGGGWTFENCVLVCAHDNVSKGNRDVEEWLESKGY